MKVLMTLYGDETLKDVDTPEGIIRTMQAWGEFGEAAAAAGVLIACEALEAADTSTTVRVDGGRRHITDGPFIETKEQLGGFIVMDVRDLDEAIRVSNGIKYGLSSSIFTQDVNTAFRAMRDLEAGITYINAGTIGAEVHLPFGGVKGTGNGHREAGIAALDFFSEWKSVYVDYSGKLQRAQIDTTFADQE